MSVPVIQQYRVARYIAGQKLRGVKRYPLVLMLINLLEQAERIRASLAALAGLAREAGVPLLVVRAVIDGADAVVPARLVTAARADGGLDVLSTLAWLACSPSQWRAAFELARGFRAALLTLQRVAHEVHT